MTKAPDETAVKAELASIRDGIDDVDARIQGLITERAALARRVGEIKAAAKLRTVDYFRPEREAEVLRRVVARNADGASLSDREMVRLFREIMSACLAQQEPLKIAYLGPEGTFTQTAVLTHFGHSVRDLPLATIDEVFQEVEAAHADFGVVPIENSTEGTVNNTLDMLISSPLKIGGEIELRIEQHLMGSEAGLDKIERICAHPQSLAQCRAWLREYLPNVELIPVSSNAAGARRARDESGTAAIAGEAAAKVYGLEVLVANIEDRSDNTTRFLVLGRKLLSPSGDDKTTLLLSADDTIGAGALHTLLQPFADNNVSLNRIESRPSRRGKWQYVFFLDVDGHAEDAPVAKALDAVGSNATLLRVLGSYPRAIL